MGALKDQGRMPQMQPGGRVHTERQLRMQAYHYEAPMHLTRPLAPRCNSASIST